MHERTFRTVATTVAALAAVVAMLATVGCTEADVVRSETALTALTVDTQTAGGTSYDVGSSGISQILIRPIDPDAAAAAGPTGEFGLLANGFNFDLFGGDVVIEGNALHPGTYEVTTVVLRPPFLTNLNPALPGDPVECTEKIADYPGTAANFVLQEYRIDFTVLPSPPRVVVARGDVAGVTVAIDVDLLIDTYVSLFGCRDSGSLRCGFNGPLPPCLFSFDENTEFAELAAAAISFP